MNAKLNARLKRLIRQLGEAIHDTVSESEDIAGVVREIRQEGFDVLLMLEATIGLNELEDEDEGTEAEATDEVRTGEFSAQDLNFLKSLRIAIEEEPAEEQKPLALPPGESENPAAPPA